MYSGMISDPVSVFPKLSPFGWNLSETIFNIKIYAAHTRATANVPHILWKCMDTVDHVVQLLFMSKNGISKACERSFMTCKDGRTLAYFATGAKSPLLEAQTIVHMHGWPSSCQEAAIMSAAAEVRVHVLYGWTQYFVMCGHHHIIKIVCQARVRKPAWMQHGTCAAQ